MLTLRSISPDGHVETDKLDVFSLEKDLPPDHVARVGDVVVRLTAPYTAVLIDGKTEGVVIPSNFIVIRKLKGAILPEYLFWLLNTVKTRKNMYAGATTNALAATRARYFMEMPVRAIPLADQRRIAKMNLLAKRESSLLARLAKEKEIYYAAVIDRLHGKRAKNDN